MSWPKTVSVPAGRTRHIERVREPSNEGSGYLEISFAQIEGPLGGGVLNWRALIWRASVTGWRIISTTYTYGFGATPQEALDDLTAQIVLQLQAPRNRFNKALEYMGTK